jgi:hypothetical protein
MVVTSAPPVTAPDTASADDNKNRFMDGCSFDQRLIGQRATVRRTTLQCGVHIATASSLDGAHVVLSNGALRHTFVFPREGFTTSQPNDIDPAASAAGSR